MKLRKKILENLNRATLTIYSDQEASMPPPPEVPPNVTESGLPMQSESVEASGATLDYLPVAAYCEQNSCVWEMDGLSDPIMSIMTPDGKVKQSYKCDGNSGDLLYIFMVNPNSDLNQGTYIKQRLFWKRVSQSWIPANESHVTSISVTQGITETESKSLSFSTGAQVGFDQGVNAELSTLLTESFGYSVSILNQTTLTEEFSFNAKPVEQVVGVYQLMEEFVIYPGANLSEYIEGLNKSFDSMCKSMNTFCQSTSIEPSTAYPSSSFLQISGTDDPDQVIEKRMLSKAEINKLVEHSVKFKAT